MLNTDWTLVTGGAKHLGEAICRHLAPHHALLIHYNTSQQEALKLQQELREQGFQAEIVQGSLSSAQSVKELVQRVQERFGSIKNLIHNAGIYPIKKALDTSVEEQYDLFQLHLHAPLQLVQGFLPSIKEARGRIVAIGTSGINALRINTTAPIYYASKAALFTLIKSLAKELAPSGVCVNMVSPSVLETSVDLEQVAHFPMKRPAQRAEVARVVAFLLEPESSYITAQNIEVAGGLGL